MRVATIANIPFEALETITVYGTVAAVLYILAPVVILAWWAHQAKEGVAATTTVGYVSKAAVSVVFWIIVVTFFWLMLIYMFPSSGSSVNYVNPANGIYGFWLIDWLDPKTFESIGTMKTSAAGSLGLSAEQKQAAAAIVVAMGVFELIYLVLLVFIFFILLTFVGTIPMLQVSRDRDRSLSAFLLDAGLNFVGAALAFVLLTGIINLTLNGLLAEARSKNALGIGTADNKIDVRKDLGWIIRLGAKSFEEDAAEIAGDAISASTTGTP